MKKKLKTDDGDRAYELYQDLCAILDKYNILGAACLGSLIGAIWYKYPVLNMEPQFIADQVKELLEKWRSNSKVDAMQKVIINPS